MGQTHDPNTADEDNIPSRIAVRTDPDAGYGFRFETIATARDVLDESSNTKAILAACDHAARDRRGKERALAYLADRLPPGELAEVADRLSTPQLQIGVSVDVVPGEDPAIETEIVTEDD